MASAIYSFKDGKWYYVEARYNKDYSISKEQLEYLITRVEKLKELTKEICLQKRLNL